VGTSGNTLLAEVLTPREGWRRVRQAALWPAELDTPLSADGPFGGYVVDAEAGIVQLEAGHKCSPVAELEVPGAVAVSPDGRWLSVADQAGEEGSSFRIEVDGRLGAGERFYSLHRCTGSRHGGVSAWRYDEAGRLFAATELDVQVLDRNGRVRAILPTSPLAISLAFGGPGGNDLFVRTAEGAALVRRLAVREAPLPFIPIDLPDPDPA
jgi:sugar lactone lactonase YvrE